MISRIPYQRIGRADRKIHIPLKGQAMPEKFDYKDDYERLFDKNYLRWFHLEGEPALCEIVSVSREELTIKGGHKKKSPVLVLKQIKGSIEDMKPLVGNSTNMDAIAAMHGRKPKDWVGKRIVLFQSETKLNGKVVPCIRVRKPKS